MTLLIDKLEPIEMWSGMTAIADEQKKTRHLDFGWPRLNAATLGLDSGVFIIPGPANLGKCLAAGTMISMADGGLRPIESVQAEDGIFVLDQQTLKTKKATVAATKGSGLKPCWKIRTSLGHEITATDNHPFLTVSGWVEVRDLKVGSRVATAGLIRHESTSKISDEECVVLGLMIGDGYCAGYNPSFTTADPLMAKALVDAVERLQGPQYVRTEQKTGNKARTYKFGIRPGHWRKSVSHETIAESLGITGSYVCMALNAYPRVPKTIVARVAAAADEFGYGRDNPQNGIVALLKRHGIYNRRAADKHVPEAVLKASLTQQAIFLSHLFACDGNAYACSDYCSISYSSKSERLIRDVQHMLLGFGIPSRVRRRSIKCNGARHESWDLSISERGSVVAFIQKIGIAFKDGQTAAALAIPITLRSRNSVVNLIPAEIGRWILDHAGTRRLPDPVSTHVSSIRRRGNAIHRDAATQIGAALNDSYLQALGNSDVVWDRIVSIEYAGEFEVFDLDIPESRNFVANNFVVHNSAVLLNIYSNVITHNEDAFVIDFSLDDSREDRFRNSVARLAKLPINWIKLPHLIPDEVKDEAKDARKKSALQWKDTIAPQLQIIDETGLDNSARKFSVIRQVVNDYRSRLPDFIKLVVCLDGLHNVIVDEMPYADDVPKQNFLSTELKNLATNTKSVIIASAQTPKKSMRRGLDQDSVKGAGGVTYDAKIIAPIFSDYAVNRGNAEISHSAIVPDGPLVPVQLPVIELDVAKNKAGSFKDIIFYRFYPYCAYIEEAEDMLQSQWRKTVYGGTPS